MFLSRLSLGEFFSDYIRRILFAISFLTYEILMLRYEILGEKKKNRIYSHSDRIAII